MFQIDGHTAASAAAAPALVEHFAIDGLFGYRSVSFSSSKAATILIARNGSGKTTLIAALDAFLRGHFSRFSSVSFSKITCRLKGCTTDLVVTKEQINQLMDITRYPDLAINAKAWDIQPLALLELIETVRGTKVNDLLDSPTFNSIYIKLGYDSHAAKALCEKMLSRVDDINPELMDLRNTIKSILGDIEIVYLPTYRRIELSLASSSDSKYYPGSRRKRTVLSKLGLERSGLYTADIQFGLGDISDRLKALYSEMLAVSNSGYGKVSANIINDLISGEYKSASLDASAKPTQEALEIFFNRIKLAERGYGPAHYRNFVVNPNLSRVFTGDVPEDAAPFLNYFLEQLNSIIQQTKGTEELVEAFIDSCNNYLSTADESTDGYGSSDSYDNKQLMFNRRNFKVRVVSKATSAEIPMESLSSGEKQMISLFARLYLYPGKKLILIDEPELSLSLDWQRKILVDVLGAPSCRQVIAITHSPFIFDNELESYAGALRLKVEQKSPSSFEEPNLPNEMAEDDE